jgi:phosphogluconate dehydratase
VNQFHAAGGIAFVIRELLRGGLLFRDVETMAGSDLGAYAREPWLQDGQLAYRDVIGDGLEPSILRPIDDPFQATGGLALLTGNLGRAVVKTSAVRPEHLTLMAPARVFESQEQFLDAFKANQFDRDVIVVIRQQGPKANGMPELHGLMPALGALESRGLRVALLTDGRLSGASGKILSALHVTPEAESGGPIGLIQDGDLITIDAAAGRLELAVDAGTLAARVPVRSNSAAAAASVGRDLFSVFRGSVGRADFGAATFWSKAA